MTEPPPVRLRDGGPPPDDAPPDAQAVADAVVVGVPDDKFGQAITAVVEPAGPSVDESELIEHVKAHLAHYKAPKRVLEIDTIGRAPNAKVDYKRLTSYACDELGISS